MKSSALHLFDPERGEAALRLEALPDAQRLQRPQKFNYFTIFWIAEGMGHCHADLASCAFQGPALLFFNPYQTFFLTEHQGLRGLRLQFHANFFCIETHHEEVGCNGVLFNEIYGPPVVQLEPDEAPEFETLLSQLAKETEKDALAQSELLVSYLKVFLIKATRLKLAQHSFPTTAVAGRRLPDVLAQLRALIESHYQTLHSPAAYADRLNITPKALGRLVKLHWGRTFTQVIRERLLKHAKWQLLHTARPVKDIAWELGFEDELYFSRLFKQGIGMSPSAFREFETRIRGGSNLSM